MVIADTGFWVAIMSQKDKHHLRALQAVTNVKTPLVTTWPVITETCYLLLKKEGTKTQHQFISSIVSEKFQIFGIKRSHAPRISELMKQYADLPMDLADASLVILAEHLGHGRILSADQRDFNTYE